MCRQGKVATLGPLSEILASQWLNFRLMRFIRAKHDKNPFSSMHLLMHCCHALLRMASLRGHDWPVEAAVCRWLPIQGQYFEGRHKGNGDDCFVIYLFKRYNNVTILTFSSSFVPMIKLPFKLLPSVVHTSLFQTLSFFCLFILGFKRLFNLVPNFSHGL